MNTHCEYKNKYIKYKIKYLELSKTTKNNNYPIQIGNGNKNLIIHISGCQGSGKTTLGNKLKEKFGDLIHLEDLDNLYAEFVNQNQKSTENFQEYINNYIQTNGIKPIILTGLTANKCLGSMDSKDNTFYTIDTKYKFFIDLNDDKVLRQRFLRQVLKLYERKEKFFELWLDNSKNIQSKLFRFVDLNKWKKNNKSCKKIHKTQGYKFMSSEDIYKKVSELLEK